jgi:Domain of unknown function (DUF4410)
MRPPRSTWLLFLGLVALAGCSSIKVSDRQEYQGPRLPRPGRIIVYDFAVTPEGMPEFAKAGHVYVPPDQPLEGKPLENAKKGGAVLAQKLVEKIDAMGLNAVRAEGQPPPQVNDIVLVGYFGKISQGSMVERVVVGFGEGDAKLDTHVEGWRMTEKGLVPVGSGSTSSDSMGGPGLIIPAVVTVATANPIGLAVGGAVKAGEAIAGKGTVDDTAEKTADKIAEVLQERFQKEGWI